MTTETHPLVSVICLCYNQAQFVEEAILSVLDQDYPHTELIVVDDFSTDGSREVIDRVAEKYPQIQVIKNEQNLGNCQAFNRGFQQSKGSYLIDLAADDLLVPTRISMGIHDLENREASYGVQYGEVTLVDANGKPIRNFYEKGNLQPASGDLYTRLITTFFISAPSMLIRRRVLEELGGYDESLAYEDFDFWIRSSRDYLYSFTPEVTVFKRIHSNNFSDKQQKFRNHLSMSTFKVCEKIYALSKSQEEYQALIKRCRYEIRQNVKQGNPALVFSYVGLIRRVWKKL
ncbi:MAG: glycosyltransferase [Cyclobacteriaceae bacterium]